MPWTGIRLAYFPTSLFEKKCLKLAKVVDFVGFLKRQSHRLSLSDFITLYPFSFFHSLSEGTKILHRGTYLERISKILTLLPFLDYSEGLIFISREFVAA